MSYSILYRSMFVKLSDGRFIPMMEMGDNNVWDCNYGRGRDRRSRDWSNINLNHGQKFFTEDEIKDNLKEWNNAFEAHIAKDMESGDEWERKMAQTKDFGYYEAIRVYGKHTTMFKDVKNIILSGVKNCISIEDAIKKCGLKITYWKKEEGDTALTCQKYERFSTEEEMLNIINEKFGGDGSKFYFIYNDNYETNKCYDMFKAVKGFARGGKNKGKSFIVTCAKRDNDNKYYLNLGVNGFSLTENVTEATRFEKYKSGNVSLTDIVFNEFKDVNSLKCIY